MANRLAGAISPYLRSHADNPVDWQPWSDGAFVEAERRDVPVLVSIGYSTCHWCHVMARESFSDPDLAAYLNEHFVAVKVDREEHPEVDASFLAAASAFTSRLGWPLNVFTDPAGRAFFAGTYFPPEAVGEHASFRQVLAAVVEAWTERRRDVESTAAQIAAVLEAARADDGAARGRDGGQRGPLSGRLPSDAERAEGARSLVATEDAEYGGFGGAPKFPVAPLLSFLLGEPEGAGPAVRALRAMAASPLRDPVDGGFFRYATRRDWSEPHYERMLYDNALLLDDYTVAWKRDPGHAEWAREAAEGIARFLTEVLQLPGGGFASAQDSESVIDGERVEGRYYLMDAADRAAVSAPALDRKVLTGWNGLAIGALARAAFAFGRADWLVPARRAAEVLSPQDPSGGLVHASEGSRVSDATATLEDYGAFADGLLALSAATGEPAFAITARGLIDRLLAAGAETGAREGRAERTAAEDAPGSHRARFPFAVPGGGDPVLAARGLGAGLDTTDGATPSGPALAARASYTLYLLSGDRRYREAAETVVRRLSGSALQHPMAYGWTLALARDLTAGPSQLVVVSPDDAVAPAEGILELARRADVQVAAAATDAQAAEFENAGFELFSARRARHGAAAAYVCFDFVCSLPAGSAGELRAALAG